MSQQIADTEARAVKSAALKFSVVFSTIGLIAAMLVGELMFGPEGLEGVFLTSFNSLVAAMFGLYAASVVLGLLAGNLLCRVDEKDPRMRLIGIGLALGCLFTSVLAGAAVQFFAQTGKLGAGEAFAAYVFKPVFWVLLFGIIPASILGVLYIECVKRVKAKE